MGLRFGLLGVGALTLSLLGANLLGIANTIPYYLIQLLLMTWIIALAVKAFRSSTYYKFTYFRALRLGMLTGTSALVGFYLVRLLANLIKYGTFFDPQIASHGLFSPQLAKLFILPAGLILCFIITYAVANAYREQRWNPRA